MYKKVVEFSFTPTKNILVFSFSVWFQFIQRIEHLPCSSTVLQLIYLEFLEMTDITLVPNQKNLVRPK